MDEHWLFSARLADLDPADCNHQIQAAIQELRTVFGKGGMRVVHWNDSYVGIAITVQVKIPTRGPVGGVDIREQEPLLLLLHRTRYPHEAPRVRSDRLDFPVERLAHLNPVLPGQPASLCLHRSNVSDWFAEHSLISLVERAQGWLRDAASNRLIREHDRFEATRTEVERRVGVAIYDPAQLKGFIRSCWAAGEGRGAAALLCRLPGSASQDPSLKGTPFPIRVYTACSLGQAVTFRAEVEELNRLHGELDGETDRGLVGLLVWPDEDRICGDYFGSLPHTLATLNEFAGQLGLPLRTALHRYHATGLQLLGGVPVILVVQRPQPLIGSESSIELLNLVLCASGDHWPDEGGWKPDTPVLLLGNRTPVTVRLARELSAMPAESHTSRVLVLGCGALGSKMGLHLARAGLTGLTLVDNDDLSPHNLIRHGLLANSVGENKAGAVRKSIEAIFRDDLTNV